MEHTPTRREYFRLVYPENCHWVVKGDPEQAVDERLATMLESMICQKMGGKKKLRGSLWIMLTPVQHLSGRNRHLSVIKDIGSDYYYHSDRTSRPRVHNPMLGGKVDYLHTGMSTDDLLRCVIYYMRKRNHPFIRECEDTAKYYLELGI
jgi:hypothetical protein